jgi:hypothetical protein
VEATSNEGAQAPVTLLSLKIFSCISSNNKRNSKNIPKKFSTAPCIAASLDENGFHIIIKLIYSLVTE